MSPRLPKFFRRIPVAALLLPLLVSRALIPGGLMPVMGADGGLGLMLCPGAIGAMPGHSHPGHAADTGGSMHHDHDGTDGTDGPASAHQNVCPFAVLVTPACASTVVAFATFTMHHALVASRDATQVHFPTLVRTQSPRAPPRYS